MAYASFLTPSLVLSQGLRLTTASIAEVQYYNGAAYRRMEQVYRGNQDAEIVTMMFPKATIQLLLDLEEAWWPQFITKAAKTILWQTKNGNLVTGFKPECIVKTNQTLIELETFKLVENFYAAQVSDNANINLKDKYNYDTARDRYLDKWSECMEAMHFYDVNQDGVISKIEENSDIDPNYYSSDRRYF